MADIEWDEVVDEAVTEALHSLGLIQHFADEDDRFDGVACPDGRARELTDVCAEVRAMLREGMREAGYVAVQQPAERPHSCNTPYGPPCWCEQEKGS